MFIAQCKLNHHPPPLRAKCSILRPDGAPFLDPIWFYKHSAPPALTLSTALCRHRVLRRKATTPAQQSSLDAKLELIGGLVLNVLV
jgi:hypothetical protein